MCTILSNARHAMNLVYVRFIAVTAFAMVIFISANATTYYTAASGSPSVLANWWTGTDGTGTHPANFTTAGDVFEIQNGHIMITTGSWTVTGSLVVDAGGIFSATSTGTTIILGL
ncbi:MAG: hypothetical protein IPP73_12530 [Chitinophagaceae bacterium]|nr:hypothetical protein [Chitinophagaceae bacterium]